VDIRRHYINYWNKLIFFNQPYQYFTTADDEIKLKVVRRLCKFEHGEECFILIKLIKLIVKNLRIKPLLFSVKINYL